MSESALVVQDVPASPTGIVVSNDQMDLVRRVIAPDSTPDELRLFIYDNQRRGVHPLDKLIHFTKRKGKYTPITSIDFMRTRAAETDVYAGSDDAVFVGDPGEPGFSARVTVHRMVQGQPRPFTATARWSEYYPGDDQGFMWRKMPHTMLAKCAEALALRKGFPQQLSGLYAAEEMEQVEREDAPMVHPTPAQVAVVRHAQPAAVARDVRKADHQADETIRTGLLTITDKRLIKEGSNASGSWELYSVTFSDGRQASMFGNAPFATLTSEAFVSGCPVVIETKPSARNPKYLDLTHLEIASTSQPETDAYDGEASETASSEPREPLSF